MNQVFGVPPNQVPQNSGFNLFPPQQGGMGGGFFGGGLPQQHTPLGNLAAFKGDLIYPVFTIGFFIVGVVVVVKVLLSLLGLLAAKLFLGAPRSLDELLERKRRSVDGAMVNQEELDGLTSVIMAALDSQQCQQRLMCELGVFVQKYDTANLIAGLAERLVPDDYLTQVKAFKSAGHCDKFVCGKTPIKSGTTLSSKDVESL